MRCGSQLKLHKGINQVKKTKINILVYSYQILKMKLDKSFKDMFNRFWHIVSTTEVLGKT